MNIPDRWQPRFASFEWWTKRAKVSVTRFAVSLMAFGPDPSNELIILGSMLKVDVVPAFLRPGATSRNVTVGRGRCRMSSTPTVGEVGLPSVDRNRSRMLTQQMTWSRFSS